ncbi:M20/M25/M40 family metallo-hydrolase [Streptomyces sp. RS10V-4]|uniref:M20/M25/M40 family metallo-hydrolase n=1 Tax=Streptomyces rhizoryzae TaxID=2932493 RepID=UPI002004B51D|nr:M20/M25/M40 family metallo-hydrolase [Streptomyces rhizoryzae]MCK7621804.1 M20/M25/M40 family metallo-hydrolase [Streptomyces rhizoryzae]
MNAPSRRAPSLRRTLAALAAGAVVLPLAASAPAGAETTGTPADVLAQVMSREVTGAHTYERLEALQQATLDHGGTRVSGTAGYDASADYLTRTLTKAGYQVRKQPFEFLDYDILSEKGSVVAPAARDLHPVIARFSVSTPEGGLKAELARPAGKSTGCSADDYAGQDVKGKIVLVDAGTDCFITQKQLVLSQLGAAAMLMNVNSPNANLNLRYRMVPPSDARIPTATLSRAESEALRADAANGPVTLDLDLRGNNTMTKTYNLLADTPTGSADHTVVMGAHLDTVDTTAGANDNGAAAAAVLETAVQLAKQRPHVKNRVRFAWWAAEEKGLAGSQYYVDQLTAAEKAHTALYLNLEMIASPNFARMVYNGQTATGPAPAGSTRISDLVTGYFARQKLPTIGLVLDGRSDHTAFVNAGIPSGGVNAGADTVKSQEWADLFGGTAGQMLDPCYHQACDVLGGINKTILDQNARAMAWAVGRFAVDTSDIGPAAQ